MAAFSMWAAAPERTCFISQLSGHEAWGLDFVPVAIERAKAKAAEREVTPIS